MELDRTQKMIVESTEKKIVAVAGAGSGKTAVLTQRIRHLIRVRGVKPEDITAITFTNMAAEEMKERLSDIEGIENTFIGTIHSFANHILKESGKYYRILSDDVFIDIMNRLIGQYGKYLTKERYAEYVVLVNECKAGNVERERVLGYFEERERYEFEMFTRKHTEGAGSADYPESVYTYAKKHDILTFDELIVMAKREQSEKSLHFEYVFVDEYQDVGNLEDAFIQCLEADNYFLVGDDWQSIYGFKGANVTIFKQYIKSKEWRTYYLFNNYRNAVGIIEFSRKIISQVSDRVDKTIVAKNRDRGNVTVGNKKELNAYLRRIGSREYGEWFVLTRTRSDLNMIIKLCEKMKIPAVTFSKAELSLSECRELEKCGKVKVLTVHAAKGLEAKNVILYGNFPLQISPDGSDSVKLQKAYEERRVMYVGATRAKNRLVLLNE